MIYQNRTDAGRRLAERLAPYRDHDPVVIALPRGGVPVAYEIARALGAPLDVLVARKLGAPGHAELAVGAIAEDGASYVNREMVAALGVTPGYLARVTGYESAEIDRRVERYRGGRPPADVLGRTAIVVDDGLATGATVRAAVRALRARRPRRVVVAAPVCAPEAAEALRAEADEVVCLAEPGDFHAVGAWYEDFAQTADDEVVALLDRAARRTGREPSPVPPSGAGDRRGAPELAVRVGDAALDGDLVVPAGARGLVLFAHGSGSGRGSPRNRFVAAALEAAGFATLLVDLLTADEQEDDARTQRLRFDVPLLARRLVAATDWAAQAPPTRGLPVGYFGASTGAGAALAAAAERRDLVRAVVSRGGRPDLAGDALARVEAPTLLIVGSDDEPVIAVNDRAMERLRAHTRLSVVPGASHLFEEPGALERVARLAAEWFSRYLAPHAPGPAAAGPARR